MDVVVLYSFLFLKKNNPILVNENCILIIPIISTMQLKKGYKKVYNLKFNLQILNTRLVKAKGEYQKVSVFAWLR